jgi:hypothetical protein
MKRVILIALACGLAACGADKAQAPEPDNSVVINDNGTVAVEKEPRPCNGALSCDEKIK